ncbi:hypothetical protein GCM10027515_09510 [Schumannella luteola]
MRLHARGRTRRQGFGVEAGVGEHPHLRDLRRTHSRRHGSGAPDKALERDLPKVARTRETTTEVIASRCHRWLLHTHTMTATTDIHRYRPQHQNRRSETHEPQTPTAYATDISTSPSAPAVARVCP